MRRHVLALAISSTALASSAFAQIVGPSAGGQTPYIIPTAPGVQTVSIISNGASTGSYNGTPLADITYTKTGGGTYRLGGIPDGMGAYDNGDGTFTLLVNHEIGAGSGVARAHGTIGSYVSQWIVNKNAANLTVVSGKDLIENVAGVAGGTAPFGRFCSADLPTQTAFFNASSGLGTTEKIFMNGEEVGAEGRAFGTVVSTNTAFYLPRLGKFSWENSLANPFPQNKTIVMGMDDSSPGEVYVYVGTKTNTGNAIDRAGLNNGTLYGLKTPVAIETTAAPGVGAGTLEAFTTAEAEGTGANLQTLSTAKGITKFARPEDGVWNPAKPNEFYWVNTGNGSAIARLYRMSFTDITQAELGGTVQVMADVNDGPEAMDNMTLVNGRDGKTRILIQEDGGTTTDDIWMYTVEDDAMLKVATHDPLYSFANAAESSGIIPAWDLLGDGWFITNTQAHYGIAGELVEGGQVHAIFIPQSIPEPTALLLIGAVAPLALRRRGK